MPAHAAANSATGSASPLGPRYTTSSAPRSRSTAAPVWAAASSVAYVVPVDFRPSATRSGSAVAAMSSRVNRFIKVPSVGCRQRLGGLDGERPAVDGERARARPGAQQLQAGLDVDVPLDQLRAT